MMTNDMLLGKLENVLKAITTTDLGASRLAPAKQQLFVRTVSQATRILDEARRIDMTSHTHDIDRIAFGSRILQAATEGEAPTGEAKPEFSTNKLESVEVIGVSGITDSTLEDNIEREGFEDTLIQLIAERVGVDLEELFLNGDKASSDPFLAKTDGWLKKAANLVQGTTDFDPTNVEAMFDAMIHAVPKKYLRDRSQWRFYVHWDIEDAYRDILRARGTGLGDTAQTTATQLAYKGIPVVDSANMPAGTALLVNPANLVYGIYRDIRIEPDRQPKARRTDFVTTLRVDCNFEDENAAVVAQGYTG
ncbi:phage major capsid protein [Geobacillus stearothermophilus]|uniref:phage major capsid protein n=1 Tax=Geobacillus TaxID=129337 RepID=UPI0009AEDDFE|nr:MULTISPECIES: phage major capsid protein [Geobacillus]MED4830729.1 phage major capsid protein [Geobacillus stearothermophilus]OPX00643.1 major capsid protein [Geobacillus sp. LEMMY01]